MVRLLEAKEADHGHSMDSLLKAIAEMQLHENHDGMVRRPRLDWPLLWRATIRCPIAPPCETTAQAIGSACDQSIWQTELHTPRRDSWTPPCRESQGSASADNGLDHAHRSPSGWRPAACLKRSRQNEAVTFEIAAEVSEAAFQSLDVRDSKALNKPAGCFCKAPICPRSCVAASRDSDAFCCAKSRASSVSQTRASKRCSSREDCFCCSSCKSRRSLN